SVRSDAMLAGSSGSWPAIAFITSAQSRTVRVSGPQWSNEYALSITPARLTSPELGFSPMRPQCAAGLRTEPPVSVPIANIERSAATAAPEPLLEPPVSCAVFQGLRGTGQANPVDTPP